MAELSPSRTKSPQPESGGKPVDPSPAGLPGAIPHAAPNPTPLPPPTANQLSPEEQLALFEKDLKENDWGHQPC
jgi:hypothetical protein